MKANGRGGESIYGREFPDENFDMKLDQRGVFAMANAGRDTNGSQFFILSDRTPWLQGKHVGFGMLIEGFDVLKKMEQCGTRDGATTQRVAVVASGQLYP